MYGSPFTLKAYIPAAASGTGTKYAKFGGRSLISFSVTVQRARWQPYLIATGKRQPAHKKLQSICFRSLNN